MTPKKNRQPGRPARTGQGPQARSGASAASPPRLIEGLESRRLMFATVSDTAGDLVVEPAIVVSPAGTDSASVEGYTPAEIREEYGFDAVSFTGGTVAGDGTGQTIAIVIAHHHPNIESDLATFSDQFDLPDADLTVADQTGGTNYPEVDAGWAGETALDVEWAHAIAPGADLLLVEAASNRLEDLLAAVDYARDALGVTVVSMSWGTGEFVG